MSESTSTEMNETAKATNRAETRERWRGLVAEQRASGESKMSFCRGRGISYARFLYWSRRLEESGESRARADAFQELGLRAPGILALQVGGGGFEIVWGEVMVRVASGFDEGELARLLRAVFEATRLSAGTTRPAGEALRSC